MGSAVLVLLGFKRGQVQERYGSRTDTTVQTVKTLRELQKEVIYVVLSRALSQLGNNDFIPAMGQLPEETT